MLTEYGAAALGCANANEGTHTVALNSAPVGGAGGVGVSVASDNADVAASPSAPASATPAIASVEVAAADDATAGRHRAKRSGRSAH